MKDSSEGFEAVPQILGQFRAERDHLGEVLMKELHTAMPWGLEIDLPNGAKATLTKMGKPKRRPIYDSNDTSLIETPDTKILGFDEWEFMFDFRLINCDQDHIELTVKITGGGGSC